MHGELKATPCEEEDSHEFLYLDIKDEIVFAPKAHSKFSGKQYLRLTETSVHSAIFRS